jgi:hypothetical protein
MSDPKQPLYVPDATLFKAVMFAHKLMNLGKPLELANTIAANEYGVEVKAVAHYTSQEAARNLHRRPSRGS